MGEVSIDIEYLTQIAGQDVELVMEIINGFEHSSLTELQTLTKQITPDVQLDAIGQILHKLRGSSSSLGMVSLSKLLAELEAWDAHQWQSEKSVLTMITDHLTRSVQLCKNALS